MSIQLIFIPWQMFKHSIFIKLLFKKGNVLNGYKLHDKDTKAYNLLNIFHLKLP